ncbi:MAG: lamin tail domain-containing protein [Candidatus Zambryskibacteria bacterium]|nr:lamin tail domain-containing protein [Candidatus Zambryskibacteria bacterium]
MKLFRILVLALLFFLPVFSHAQVIINEIAWMGTTESSNAEWIELYNTTDGVIDLTGWKLYEAGGGTLIISLSKTISPQGYFVIERTTPSVTDPIPGINDVSGSFGGSGLNNSGENLVLKDSSGNIVQSLDFSTGWPAGDSASKKTMQWTGSIWITASSTPGLLNASQADSNESETTGNDSTATTTDETTTDVPTSNQTSYIISAHSSPAPLSNTEEEIKFEISAGRDRLTAVGNNLMFRAIPTKFQNMSELGITYCWSFGDGTVAQGKNVNHTYKFSGDYSVVVNANYSDKQAVSRMQVKVISPNTSIAKVSGGVEISNNSKVEINLEGWSLISPKKTFIFPTDTLIASGKKITFADEVTGMLDDTIQLLNPLGKELSIIKKTETGESKLVVGETGVNLNDIQVKIEDVKNKIAQIKQTQEQIQGMPLDEMGALNKGEIVTIQENKQDTSSVSNIEVIDNSSQTTNIAQVFEAIKQDGLVSRIFSWPIKGFNFVRRLFVEE